MGGGAWPFLVGGTIRLVDPEKWYIHKTKFFVQNETHENPCNFEVHTEHRILAKKSARQIRGSRQTTEISVKYESLGGIVV